MPYLGYAGAMVDLVSIPDSAPPLFIGLGGSVSGKPSALFCSRAGMQAQVLVFNNIKLMFLEKVICFLH